MTNEIFIAGRKISINNEPYIIAEMSANHNGDIDTAFKIIEAAKNAGVDAVKLQTYRPDTITLKSELPDFQISEGLWKGRTLYDLYEWAHTPWEWHKDLFFHARKLGITIFSTPFDNTSVDFLEDLNVPAYKIASFELVDLKLINYVASTGKPMILSTGLAQPDEIQDAIDAAKEGGCSQLAILHCVSGYPAPATDYNLRTIGDMIDRFGLVTGLSDHTLGTSTSIVAVSLGASIIEKHFTLDRNSGGPDDSFSLEPIEMKNLCSDAKTAWHSLGCVDYGIKSSEHVNKQFRRSLYCVKDIKAGEVLTSEHIRSVRPGYGLAPKYLNKIINRRVKIDINFGTAIKFEYLL